MIAMMSVAYENERSVRRHMGSFLSRQLGTLMALPSVSWWRDSRVNSFRQQVPRFSVESPRSLPKSTREFSRELVTLGLRWRARNKRSDGGPRPRIRRPSRHPS